MIELGVKNIIMCDKFGIICRGDEELNAAHAEISLVTNAGMLRGKLAEAMKGADVIIGVSAPNVVSADMVRSMADKPIIFTMANPVPEIAPELAAQAGAFIVGTGSSQYANQINNLLVFPGLFRGALDVRASTVNTQMMIAAPRGIAECVAEDKLSRDYILPYAYDKSAHESVAKAVAQAAISSGVSKLFSK